MCHYSREKTYPDHLFLKTIENDHKELRVKKNFEFSESFNITKLY